MRWLERSVDRGQMPSEELDVVARSLEAAAHEAPPSHRAEEIRASVLAEVDGGVGASAGVGLLALAAVAVLLALVVSVGAPAVGSLLDSWFDRSEVPGPVPSIPAEPSPSPFLDEDDLRERIRSGPPSPSASDAPIGPCRRCPVHRLRPSSRRRRLCRVGAVEAVVVVVVVAVSRRGRPAGRRRPFPCPRGPGLRPVFLGAAGRGCRTLAS